MSGCDLTETGILPINELGVLGRQSVSAVVLFVIRYEVTSIAPEEVIYTGGRGGSHRVS